MKKGFILSGLLALSIIGCSTPMININQDFSVLEKEYKSFSTKALSDAYVKRMFAKYLAPVNSVQLTRQLEFSRYLKSQSDTSYETSLKSMFSQTPALYDQMTGIGTISNKMSTETATFGSYVIGLSPYPGIPVATSATNLLSTSFTANWNPVANATGYKLYIDGTLAYTGTALTFDKTGLLSGSSHTYYVQATNSGGTSTDSNTINVTTVLSVPGSLSTTAITSSGFTANWLAVSGTAITYDFELYQVGTLVATKSGNTSSTTYPVSDLTASTAYIWKVSAKKGDLNSAFSTVQTVTTDVAAHTVPAFKLVAKGTFNMGTPIGSGNANERPVHTVTFTKDLYMGEKEVTQGEWASIYDAGTTTTDLRTRMGSKYPSYYTTVGDRDNHPVEQVSWWKAIAYCNAKSIADGLHVAYNPATGALLNGTGIGGAIGSVTTDTTQVTGYRLPTEAEWEYAARGGKDNWNNGNIYSGSNDASLVAVISASSSATVGSKSPNELELYDMSGNAGEWTQDYNADYSSGAVTNPYISSGSDRVTRGGSWGNFADIVRSAYRNSAPPDYSNIRIGFRIARSAN